VRPLIESKRHSVTMQLSGEPVHVLGDRTRLVQILSNILNNAAKYTPPGGQITLRVSAPGDQVVVCVSDNGIGIEPDVLPYIFELFTQAERTPDRSQGGLGIGLALVKSLVALHGGSVEARSEAPGLGSEFEIRLPRIDTAGAEGDGAAGERASAQVEPLRVMVVDDNQDAAQMLATLLEVQGHAVSVEYDGRGALLRARLERPQVMLLDIGLPDTDGYALARQLRAVPELRGATLVALTGYGQNEDRRLAEEAGFDHHLVKPADLDQVTQILAASQRTLR
jgi:CheY-like chemotaxis protein